jgi:hypothetical protein
VEQVVNVAWTLPGTNAVNLQVQLLDFSDNPIIMALLSGGNLSVATNSVWGPGANVFWATNGVSAQVAFALTGTNTINLTVVSGVNSVSLSSLVFTGMRFIATNFSTSLYN